ncbi:MAG: hypothetical protein AAF726_23275 [Planctomycetota bacterium]
MSSPDAARPVRRLLFTGLAAGLGVLLLEVALQAVTALVPAAANLLQVKTAGRSEDPRRIPDERLGERPNPRWHAHDSRGFRNPKMLESASVVALGDSQTFGTGVEREEAWPLVLGESLGEPVYNMGFPGYSPTQCLLLLEEALELKPRVVVAAMYAGNDLYDAYRFVHVLGLGADLGAPDAAAQAAIAAAEAERTLEDLVMTAYANRRRGLRGVLSRHCRIYAMLRTSSRVLGGGAEAAKRTAGPPTWEGQLARAAKRPGRFEAFESGTFRTLFTPRYRALAVRMEDPRIREGERLCLAALARMHGIAREAGAEFAVLLIPTKELVFAELAKEGDAVGDTYRRLVEDESTLWSDVRTELDGLGITFVDGTEALRAALDAGEQPYPIDHDGHPNPAGQRALASAVLEVVSRGDD